MKKIFVIILTFICMPISAYAAKELPQTGVERIWWAMECSGRMPGNMVIGFIVLAALIAATAVYAYTRNGGGKNE